MPESTGSQKHHGEEEPEHRYEGIVASPGHPREGVSHPLIESDLARVPSKELKAGEGGELLVSELKAKVAVDTAGQSAFSSSHPEWAFLSGLWVARHFPKNRKGAHFQHLPRISAKKVCRIRAKSRVLGATLLLAENPESESPGVSS